MKKKIGNKLFSCYKCQQALCKDGGKGGLAGNKTTTKCTEKATTFTPVNQDRYFKGKSHTLTPRSKTNNKVPVKNKYKNKSRQFTNSVKKRSTRYNLNQKKSHIRNHGTSPSADNRHFIKKSIAGGGSQTGYTCTDTTDDRSGVSTGTKSCQCTGGRDSYDCKKMLQNQECSSDFSSNYDLVCNDSMCMCTKAKTSIKRSRRPILKSSPVIFVPGQ